MSCTSITNHIRKSCNITIGGIKQVLVRDYESFDRLSLISSFESYGGANKYTVGNLGNFQVYSTSREAPIEMVVNITVEVDPDDPTSGQSSILDITIVSNTYYDPLWTGSDTYYFPDLESGYIQYDAGNPVVLSSATTIVTEEKLMIVNNMVEHSKSRTVNDFGESVSADFFEIQTTKQGSSFESVRVEDKATGNTNYTNTLKLTINSMTNSISDINKLVEGQRYLSILFIDTDGNAWIFGVESPAVCIKIDKKSGAKASDANNIEIVFESKEANPEYFVDGL